LLQMAPCQLLAGRPKHLARSLLHEPESQPATGEKHRRW
jgi:hypothetical protein